MKDKMYVCIFEETDGFMYQLYFKTKKKAKKFMKKQIEEYMKETEYTLPLVNAHVCKIIKSVIRGTEEDI